MNTNKHENNAHEADTKILYKDLSFLIQGCCFEISKEYGTGQKESVYVNLLKESLEMKGLQVEKEKSIQIRSSKTGKIMGTYRPDLIINGKIIMEVKSTSYPIKQDERQLYHYLRNSNYELGYLVNFSTKSLFIKRIIYTNNNKPFLKILSCAFVLFFVWFGVSKAATLYAGSAYETVYEGETFVVEWYLDTEGASVNSLSLKLYFTPDTLEVAEASPGDSLISLWIKPPQFSNSQGVAELVGGAPLGFKRTDAPIFRTIFRAKTSGRASISMDQTSLALGGEAGGEPLPLRFRVLDFAVLPKDAKPVAISSPTHPDPDKWYKENRAVITFVPDPKEEYSYSMSSNLDVFPDDVADEQMSELVYENLPDGIYYFKLNSKIGPGVWQEAGVFRVQIDATAPELFVPVVSKTSDAFGGRPFLSFAAIDKVSGISHYKIKIGIISEWKTAQSPFVLPRFYIGNKVLVEASDFAGNARLAEISHQNRFWPFVFGLIMAGLIILGVGVYRRRTRHKNEP